jgi:cytochrome P450
MSLPFPHRPLSAYTFLGHGLHFCFGARLVGASLAATLREVFKLKNIRRAPGKQGVKGERVKRD